MVYNYLFRHEIYTFATPLDESNFLVSTDENQSETHYVSITEERAKELRIEWNTPPEPTLEEVRQQKIDALNRYDQSSEVNLFYVDDFPMWYDYTRRGSIKNLVESTMMLGESTITLWTETPPIVGIPFECEAALLMLAQLEVFAGKSKSVTQQHWANILALQTKEEIEAYDFTVGYPEKPHFSSSLKV